MLIIKTSTNTTETFDILEVHHNIFLVFKSKLLLK